MSPRAACRLATLGFTQVYDYMPGKVDWLARNQPVVGTHANTPTIGRHLRQEVSTARPDEPISAIRGRVARSPHRFALVTTADGTLLGRLRAAVLDETDPDRVAGEVMEAGPSTLRPHEPVAAIKDRLVEKHLSYAIVADPDGHLLGTVQPGDL